MTDSQFAAADAYHDEHEFEDFGDDSECGECGGEGGYNSCPEDCCPHIWGEEGCDDPVCWRRCSACKGKGYFA